MLLLLFIAVELKIINENEIKKFDTEIENQLKDKIDMKFSSVGTTSNIETKIQTIDNIIDNEINEILQKWY